MYLSLNVLNVFFLFKFKPNLPVFTAIINNVPKIPEWMFFT